MTPSSLNSGPELLSTYSGLLMSSRTYSFPRRCSVPSGVLNFIAPVSSDIAIISTGTFSPLMLKISMVSPTSTPSGTWYPSSDTRVSKSTSICLTGCPDGRVSVRETVGTGLYLAQPGSRPVGSCAPIGGSGIVVAVGCPNSSRRTSLLLRIPNGPIANGSSAPIGGSGTVVGSGAAAACSASNACLISSRALLKVLNQKSASCSTGPLSGL